MKNLAASLTPLFLSVSCAYYSQEDGERLNNEVYALQTQVTAMQQAISQLQDSEKEQTKKLGAMTEEMAELSKVARRNDADLGVQLEEMLQEVARMKGYVETFSERVSDLESNVGKLTGDMESRAEQQRMEVEDKAKAAELAKQRERLFSNPDELFKEVEVMIGKGQAKEARTILREFAKRAEDSKLLKKYADVAAFWIAETYLAEANFQQAAAEYNTVRKTYPKSALVPEALFKLGVCFENLKLPNDAKLFYTTVVKQHPKSKAADKAKKRLKDIK